QGSGTVLPQIAAEELGVRLEDIRMPAVDTDVSPYCLGAYSSRTTHIAGNAVKLAAADVKKHLFEVAAEKLEANVDDLMARDRKIYVKGSPERFISVADVASAAVLRLGGGPVIGKATWDSDCVIPDPVTRYGNSSSAYPFAAHVAEVEVDPRTGKVKILNYIAAQDLGRAINPMSAEGQVEGAVSQGIGYALTEQLTIRDGRVTNANLEKYKVLAALDMPPIETILIETNDPKGPFGAKGLGEPSLIPVVPAIANAIYDAVGVRITDLPITPMKIRKALAEKRAGEAQAS
ncbi:MAG: molybdopterin-dependent oxidoreductase, partial [Dehalococcoidia bacterium]|nr:molybdopterin-dependent oxidoreductase [Dehalococcoidia bacterium]